MCKKTQKYSISVNLKFLKNWHVYFRHYIDSGSLAAALIDVLWVDLEV